MGEHLFISLELTICVNNIHSLQASHREVTADCHDGNLRCIVISRGETGFDWQICVDLNPSSVTVRHRCSWRTRAMALM